MSGREPETDKPHFSPTSLGALLKCGMRYKLRYEDGLRQPPGIALTIGKANDQSANLDLTHKIETGELLSDEEVVDNARDALHAHWESEPPELDAGQKLIGRDKLKGEAVDTVVGLAKLHHEEIAPDIEPIAVQKPFRIEIPDSDRDGLGFMDILEKGRLSPEGKRVRDTKTSGKRLNENDAHGSLQLTFYSLAVWAEYKVVPEALTLDVLVKNKKPVSDVLVTHRTKDHMVALLERLTLATALVKAGTYVPTDPANWWCSKKFCGYWESACPFGKRAVTHVSFSNGG